MVWGRRATPGAALCPVAPRPPKCPPLSQKRPLPPTSAGPANNKTLSRASLLTFYVYFFFVRVGMGGGGALSRFTKTLACGTIGCKMRPNARARISRTSPSNLPRWTLVVEARRRFRGTPRLQAAGRGGAGRGAGRGLWAGVLHSRLHRQDS